MTEPTTSRLDTRDAAGNLCRQLAALVVFGISFGFVEAAVVEYLRFVWQPVHSRYFPDTAADSIFPLLTLEQLRSEGPDQMRILCTELVREAATLVMLAAAGLAIARNARQWFAGFMIAFGVWDVFYYVFLKLLIDWPASLLTWDILFLVPVPWTGPVLAPVLVSVSMIAAGTVILRSESAGRPLVLDWPHCAAIAAGGTIIVLTFCWDFPNTSAGRDPNPFHWPVFALGEVVGIGAFAHAVWSSRGRAAGRVADRSAATALEATKP